MQNILKKFLGLHKYHNLQYEFEDSFLSHPNYPSLYAITDTLSLVGIENIAAKVSKEQFFELPISFLSIYKDELVIVERSKNKVFITKENNKQDQISFDVFINDWDGIILAIEENQSKEILKNNNKSLKYMFLFGGIFLLYFFKNYQNFNLIGVLGFLLSSIGFLIGMFIVEEKYGNNENPLVSKFCSFSENASCNTVIKSSRIFISKWFDFSDLPIVFFTSALVLQLLNEQSIFVVSIMSMVSLPLVAYSIWLQKVKIKKWCVLCLAISCVLLLLFFIQLFNSNAYSVKIISDAFVIGAIVLTIWFFIKPYFSSNANLTKENLNLKKFKRIPAIFTSLLKPVSNYDAMDSFNKILIGDNYVATNVTLLLSPSCSHCHTAYKDAMELYEGFQDKINITILFNVNPNNQYNNYLDLIFTMLFINKYDPNKIIEALNDWHIVRMKLEDWLAKWNTNVDNFDNEKNDLFQQYDWCQVNNFNFTPVRLINDTVYPSEYSINEMKYFISKLEEIKEIA